MKKAVIMTLLWAVLVQGARAQFFKKILDNVKNTAQNRADGKASQTTDKAIDKVLQPTGSKSGTTPGTTGATGTADSASVRKVLGAFGGAAADNPNDTSASDLTMKALNRLIGGGGVSKADSAAAIQLFKTSQGGSGVYYEMLTTMTSKKGPLKDTNLMYFTNSGEGRTEMSIPIPGVKTGKMILLGRAGQPRYSMNIDDAQKTYSLNVIDTGLINSNGDEYTVTRVGEETVDGYHCTHAKLVSKSRFSSTTMDIWTSTSVPGYSIYKKLLNVNKVTPGMVAALDKADCNGFFVKVLTSGKDYSMTMELVRAQEKNLSASLFRIPAGYTESDEGLLGSMLSGAKKN
ncbi:MAG TPA: DUF4412 domain-containing protein [Puia sp.]|nr:DUF4412 domain-containing protein [Puia sp.]